MTRTLPLVSAGLLAGCAAARAELIAVGARDATGARIGDHRILDGAGGPVVAQGRFAHGKMDGNWLFFDSHQVKVAEFTYRAGILSGPYQTFFGSVLNPSAAGRIESKGQMQNGRVIGRHLGYGPAGEVFTDAILEAARPGANEVSRVTVGTREQAKQTAASDQDFARAESRLIRSAMH